MSLRGRFGDLRSVSVSSLLDLLSGRVALWDLLPGLSVTSAAVADDIVEPALFFERFLLTIVAGQLSIWFHTEGVSEKRSNAQGRKFDSPRERLLKYVVLVLTSL
jgi:hypothetical protein